MGVQPAWLAEVALFLRRSLGGVALELCRVAGFLRALFFDRGVVLLDALVFLPHRGLGCPLARQPFGRRGKQFLDLCGREGFCRSTTRETRGRDAELARHDLAGVWSGQTQLHEPLRRGCEKFGKLFTRNIRVLELFRCCGEVNTQLLCGGRRLHGLRRSFLIHPDSVACDLYSRPTRAPRERTPVDVTQLQHFVAVGEELHFARAAKALGISRQALSASVRALEAERGVELFDRSAESTTLSAAGRQLLLDAAPLIEAELLLEQERAREAAAPTSLSIAFVPGVTIGKWSLEWERRYPNIHLRVRPGEESESVSVLHDGIADVSFVRLPVREYGLSVIPLYSEMAVVVASKDHPVAAFEELTLADLEHETVVRNPEVIADAVELVAAGVGLVMLPQSIARLYARKDVVARVVTDAPQTEIAVAWIAEDLTADMEEFIGIVRGRKAGSSRTGVGAGLETAGSGIPASTKLSASQKTARKKEGDSKAAQKSSAAAAKTAAAKGQAPKTAGAAKGGAKAGSGKTATNSGAAGRAHAIARQRAALKPKKRR